MTHATQAVKVTPLPAKPGGAFLCAPLPISSRNPRRTRRKRRRRARSWGSRSRSLRSVEHVNHCPARAAKLFRNAPCNETALVVEILRLVPATWERRKRLPLDRFDPERPSPSSPRASKSAIIPKATEFDRYVPNLAFRLM